MSLAPLPIIIIIIMIVIIIIIIIIIKQFRNLSQFVVVAVVAAYIP